MEDNRAVKKLADWAVDRLIAWGERTPYFHLDGYMRRFWLARFWREGTEGQARYAAKIHNIQRSDGERHAHCHPWPFVSIILRGGYTETREYVVKGDYRERIARIEANGERIEGVRDLAGDLVIRASKFYGPGSILRRSAEDRHYLTLAPDVIGDGGAWTLFLTGPKRKSWFFHTEEGAIGWRLYDAWKGRQGPSAPKLNLSPWGKAA